MRQQKEVIMKIKKIVALIKESKCLTIFDGKDCQWLSDGFAMYPVFKDTEISPEFLCDMHDIDTKKMAIRNEMLPTLFNYADICKNEKQLQKSNIEIVYHGKHLIGYETSEGISFVEKRYFAPFADMDESYLMVYERYTSTGTMYFAVKNGMNLVGIVLPKKVITKEFVEDITAMSTACTIALQNVKEE